jgi:ABC-2 type transport system permease protein
MAGMSTSPQSRAQFAAIARVRWMIFVHSLRTTKGALELFSRIVISAVITAGGLGGAFGLGAAAWYVVSDGKSEFLAFLLWPVFMFWQFFPVMATAFTETLDSSSLLRFPLNYRSYVLVRLIYGALDPSTLLGGLWLTGITIGIGLARPRLFGWAALILLGFGILNMLLTQMVFAWVERWLAQRRTREIFAVLFFLLMISFQLVGPLMNRYGSKSNPNLIRVGTEVSPVQRVLPPGLAAHAIASVATGRWGSGLASTGWMLLYGVVILRVLSVRLRAQYRGENLNEVSKTDLATRGESGVRAGWDVRGVSGPVMAVLEKEFRYLSRSGPMLLTLVTPIIMLVVFGLGQGRPGGGFLQRWPDFGFPVGATYTLLLLTNLVYNNFGADGGGIQFFLVSPAQFREIVAGKNLAHAVVLGVEVVAVWIGVSLLSRPPTLAVTLATIAGLLFAVPVNFAMGNFLSLYSPKKIEFGTFGRQRASQLTVLISFGVQIVVFAIGATTFGVAKYYGDMWIAAGVFVILALAAFGFYGLVLKRVDRLALGRREILTGELCKAGTPADVQRVGE